ncbi:MAG TPA: hypothetical protein VHV77_06600 [Pirellulales bacterium]|jgi:hypothetical protein|nr:hypothetical protein [Pirellulales bacterium]
MKAERRHELQHNVLADRLGEMIEGARNYSLAITVSIVAVVVLVVAYLFYTGHASRTEAAAWTAYIAATDAATRQGGSLDPLVQLTNQYPDSRGAQWGRLVMADIQFQHGVQQQFENRAQSNMFLTSAVENYNKLRNDTTDRILQARATMGLARSYEAMNRLEQARLEYDAVITRYPDDIYVAEAKQRRADLGRPATQSFYDWFARQEVTPPAQEEASIPGHRPNFDIRSLPPEGPVFDDELPSSPAGGAANMPIGTPQPSGGQPAVEAKAPAGTAPAGGATPAETKAAPETKTPEGPSGNTPTGQP